MPTRILIADANRDRTTELAIRCERLDAIVRSEVDPRAVVQCVRQWRPHLVLLDSSMPIGRRRRMCEHMVRDPQWRHCRLIALSTPDDHRLLQQHDHLLIYSLRPQHSMWQRIEAVLDELLIASRTPMRPIDYLFDSVLADPAVAPNSGDTDHDDPPRPHASAMRPSDTTQSRTVAYIGTDHQLVQDLRPRLGGHAIDVVDALQPCTGEGRHAVALSPFLFLVDYDLPNGRGDFFVRRITTSGRASRTPLLVLTSRQDAALERRLINLGVRLVLPKPAAPATLAEEIFCQKALAGSPAENATTPPPQPPTC